MDAVAWSRYQFGFTITFHYLFPQLTMGLAFLIVIFKALALRSGNQHYNEAARFWARIFGINFAVGVVTGIPMEFQFGTNWARFSDFAGGVIGLTLAMEGMFAFFAESAFLGLFLYGEKRLSPRAHMASAVMLFLGSWLSGYFIIATNAFMQFPRGHEVGPRGVLQLADLWSYLFNPWALWEYAHNMSASVITGCFVVMAVGAYYTLLGLHRQHARIFLRIGVIVGFIFCVLQLFPNGSHHGAPFFIRLSHQQMDYAGTEIEAIKHHVNGQHGGDNKKPCRCHGVLPAGSGAPPCPDGPLATMRPTRYRKSSPSTRYKPIKPSAVKATLPPLTWGEVPWMVRCSP